MLQDYLENADKYFTSFSEAHQAIIDGIKDDDEQITQSSIYFEIELIFIEIRARLNAAIRALSEVPVVTASVTQSTAMATSSSLQKEVEMRQKCTKREFQCDCRIRYENSRRCVKCKTNECCMGHV